MQDGLVCVWWTPHFEKSYFIEMVIYCGIHPGGAHEQIVLCDDIHIVHRERAN